MKKEKQLPIRFRLAGIKTEQFAILEDKYDSEKRVKINAGIQFSAHPKENGVGVHFTIQFQNEDDTFIVLKTLCLFALSKDDWDKLLTENKESVTIPIGLSRHLSVLTIGTARGILYEKLHEQPPFNKFILPTVNVTKMVKEDTEIALS